MLFFVAVCLIFTTATACELPQTTSRGQLSALRAADAEPPFELVESAPLETTLDRPDVPDAKILWPQMIAAAQRSIDLSQFYVANTPDGALEPVMRALEAAVRRQVRVRFLVDASMAAKYPEDLSRLAAAGIELRRFELRARTGGVSHAKYFIIDDRQAFIGSQNFDWRSLDHIHEIGARLRSPQLVRELSALFESDWALAAGQVMSPPATVVVNSEQGGELMRLRLVYSPQSLAHAEAWELPRIVELIEQAKRSVRIEVLVYRGPRSAQDDTPMARIEAALIAAAARGVTVELLLSDWMRREHNAGNLRGLVGRSGISVRLVTIPQAASGEIPFARLIHAKYVVVDGQRFWLGSSNFEDNYFTRSRNVGVLVDSPRLSAQLEAIFATLWTSPYAGPYTGP